MHKRSLVFLTHLECSSKIVSANGVSISSIFVLNRVSVHDLMKSLFTETSPQAEVLPCSLPMYSILK